MKPFQRAFVIGSSGAALPSIILRSVAASRALYEIKGVRRYGR